MLGMIAAIISAASAAYGAYESSETAKVTAKQVRYNAEAEADATRKAAEQEKLNRDSKRRAESKQLKHRRARIEAAYAKSGVAMEGTPEAVLAEQVASDEEWMQNQERISIARGKGFDVAAQRALQEGKFTASAYKSKARSTLVGGVAQVSSTLASGYSDNLLEEDGWIDNK